MLDSTKTTDLLLYYIEWISSMTCLICTMLGHRGMSYICNIITITMFVTILRRKRCSVKK